MPGTVVFFFPQGGWFGLSGWVLVLSQGGFRRSCGFVYFCRAGLPPSKDLFLVTGLFFPPPARFPSTFFFVRGFRFGDRTILFPPLVPPLCPVILLVRRSYLLLMDWGDCRRRYSLDVFFSPLVTTDTLRRLLTERWPTASSSWGIFFP